MNTLLVNTASRTPGVALYSDDKIVGKDSWVGRHDESDKLLPAIQQLLSDQGITKDDVRRLICVVGPGGFTSVRIGVSAVNAWAYASGLEVAEVSLFDLYPDAKWTFVVANPSETWVRRPSSNSGSAPEFTAADPDFVMMTELELPDTFEFCGELSEEWVNSLTASGGTFNTDSMVFPEISTLVFEKNIITPWYYKDAKITWSGKNVKCKT
jgi:tRNA A37 threonylcarbamoyladenosine modification protein TsaB